MKHILICLAVLSLAAQSALAEDDVKLATFDVDATPALGSAMAYDPVKRLDELTLRCRGIVLLGAGQPIVLCAVDWIGIANEGHDAFRVALAEAAGTTPGRVAVHALHQHDAPGCDFTAEKIIKELGVPGYTRFDGAFHRVVIQRAADAIRAAVANAQAITHYGYGEAIVKEVASNRRVERTPEGKVGRMRGSSCKVEALRDLPEGVIDPVVSLLSFWNGDKPVAVLSAYACHPQSYYRLGIPSPDFPGIARFIRGQDVNMALHVHFNGAGGNVAAGKYNDGAQANRMILATRLASGMREAFETTKKIPLTAADIGWSSEPVALPPAPHLNEEDLIAKIKSTPLERLHRLSRPTRLAAPRQRGPPDRCHLPSDRRHPHAAHAGRAFRRISVRCESDAPRSPCDDGRLRRLRPRLHRHRCRLSRRRL